MRSLHFACVQLHTIHMYITGRPFLKVNLQEVIADKTIGLKM